MPFSQRDRRHGDARLALFDFFMATVFSCQPILIKNLFFYLIFIQFYLIKMTFLQRDRRHGDARRADGQADERQGVPLLLSQGNPLLAIPAHHARYEPWVLVADPAEGSLCCHRAHQQTL